MTYKEAARIINADTITMFFNQMDVTVVEFLNNVDPKIKEAVIEQYNEDIEGQNIQTAEAVNDISATDIIEYLENDVLKGDNKSVFEEYLETLETPFTIVQVDGWDKIVQLKA